MPAREFDPLHLDVAAFAKTGGQAQGRWPLGALERLAEGVAAEAVEAGDDVSWSARGETRPVRGGPSEVWLHVRADVRAPLSCQRCLRPVAVPLHVDRRFLFVPGEEAAAALDADLEDDVLALTRALDLRALVEDELLLAMPLVPRHEVCPEPLLAVPDHGAAEDDPPHPFAALAALKRGNPI